MYRRSFRLLILSILLGWMAACAPALPTPTPLPEAQPLRVSLDPSLTWLEPALTACAAAQPDLSILRADGSPDADLAITFGPPADERGFSAVLGYDDLVLVVHPNNPIDTLSATEIARLYTSETLTWQEIHPEGSGEPVEALVYATDSALHEHFLTAFSEIDRIDTDLLMLPSPAAMRAEIASRPGAIGLLPARWLDDSLKPVNLTGLAKGDALRLPMIAAADREPQGAFRAWLLCIQDILRPTNQT